MPTAAPRWILHVDLDQFLASVELLRHPELAGLPVIVGGNGDPTEPRKVVTCASYEARAYGVRAGMPLRTAARRCPEATFLPSNPAAYNAASEEVVALLRDLGYPVEVWGWDEAYLAVAPGTPDDPIEVAEEIRKVILSQTGLSCSIGISDNKQGPKTTKRLAKLGINTVYQLAHTDSGLLMSTFGPRTALWLLLAKGGGDTEVSAQAWVPRSRSHAVTFPRDLTCRSEMESAVTELAQRTLNEVVASSRTVTRVAVTVRTATFYTRTKIRKLQAPSTDPDVITAAARHVLDLFELDRPVRLLGVRLELA